MQSNRRRYGRLAAVNPTGRFFPQERVVLQAYARLVAAALDSAAAVEDARRQAQTARALLELSNSLAEIATTDEMAAHIARAVTAVIGCDRAAVILFEPERGDRPRRRDARLLARGRSAAAHDGGPGRARSAAVDVAVNVWDRDTAADREHAARSSWTSWEARRSRRSRS